MPPPGLPTQLQLEAAARAGTRAALATVFVSIMLGLVKITSGVLGNAYALVADGVESLTDVFTSLLVLAGLRWSVRPRSPDFPYGMGRAESLAAVAVSLVLLAAGVGIAVQAIREIRTPHDTPAAWTLAVLAVVVVAKEGIYRFLATRAAGTGSRLLDSDAWHHRSDALTSAAAFVGVSLALLAGPGWESADDWAALVACGVILWNGGRLLRAAIGDALDQAPADVLVSDVSSISRKVRGVLEVETVRVRRSGLALLVDIHVEVDPAVTVWEGHEIAHAVKSALVDSHLPVLDALVHVEPHGQASRTRDGDNRAESPATTPGLDQP